MACRVYVFSSKSSTISFYPKLREVLYSSDTKTIRLSIAIRIGLGPQCLPHVNCKASEVIGKDDDKRPPVAKVDPAVTAFDRDIERYLYHQKHSLTSQFSNHVMDPIPHSRILVGYVKVSSRQRGLILMLS